MQITIHRSDVVVERRNYQIRWEEFSFRPMAYECRRQWRTMYRHYRMTSDPLVVEVPIGSKVVSFNRPGAILERLETYWDKKPPMPGGIYGLEAESVARMAMEGRRGFRIVEPASVGYVSR